MRSRTWSIFAVTSVAAGALGFGGVAGAKGSDGPPVQAFAVGDFDGDGVPDVAVGLPDLKVGKVKEAGQVRLYSGKNGAFLRAFSGSEEGEGYGGALAAVGDVDGDGATDLAIASPYATTSHIDFMSGATGKRIFVSRGGDAIAWADELCPLGDGSGKTRVDLAIRWVQKKQWRYVYSDREAIGNLVTDDSGYFGSGHSVGDVDGDGKADFAIANWTAANGSKENAGSIRVISGQYLSQGKSTEQLLLLRGEQAGECLGVTLAAAGDWNGDKHADLLTGVSGDAAKKEGWTVRVFSGKDGAVLWKASGAPGDVPIGGVAMTGDVDGDGKPDVAVGTPVGKSKPGAVSVLSGADGSVLWTVPGAGRENLGDEIFPAADADGDGCPDLVVVAPGAALGGKKGNGYVRILSGKTGETISTINPLVAK